MLEDLVTLLMQYHTPSEALNIKSAFWQLWKQGWVKPPQTLIDLAYAILNTRNRLIPELQALALDTLRRYPVNNPYLTEPICIRWLAEREPLIENLIAEKKFLPPVSSPLMTTLFSLKFEHAPPFRLFDEHSPLYPHQTENRAATLVRALSDKDPQIVRNAKKVILALSVTDLALIVLHCPLECQNASLAQLLAEVNYIPAAPHRLSLLAALYARQVEKVWPIQPNLLSVVLEASQSEDKTLADTARRSLHGLVRLDTRQALCSKLTREDWPEAQKIAISHGWLPAETHEKTLFYFVTGQWAKYEAIDWDGRQLRAIYETSPQALRQRLAEVVRQSGRPEYLAIITGSEGRFKTRPVEDDEASVMVQILAANQAWPRLWELALELPLHWSVEAVRILQKADWQPTSAQDAGLLAQLSTLVERITLTTDNQMGRYLTLTAPQALFKVRGRVNDLAFSPQAAHVAIATGAAQIVVWNYAEGRREQVLRGLAHSVGRVAYLPDGSLVFGEKTTSSQTPCGLYLWKKGNLQRLGQHQGTIMGLINIGDHLVSFGRDSWMAVWNKQGEICRHRIGQWPLSLALSSNQAYLALINRRLQLIPWPLQEQVVSDTLYFDVTTSNVVFDLNCQSVWYGDHEHLYEIPIEQHKLVVAKKVAWPQPGIGFNALVAHPLANLIIGVDQKGGLNLWDAGKHTLTERLQFFEENLTSLKISPNGLFMALGHSNQRFSLWDLRKLIARRLFSLPLAFANYNHLTVMHSLNDLDPTLEPSVEYLKAVLSFRFRYDIELATESFIQPGEFDIELI